MVAEPPLKVAAGVLAAALLAEGSEAMIRIAMIKLMADRIYFA